MAQAKDGRGSHLSLDTSVSAAPANARAARPLGAKTHLAAEDVEELRVAIERSLCEGEMHDSSEFVIDAELRKSIRIACAKARLQRVRAEHVLIDVKQIWSTMPSMLTTCTSDRLSEIVTACIDEYYAKDDRAQS
jgi:hypothetical protein